ncbi:hypothetical protein [Caballeronia pedi]|nr:hypothetical protein [Caballeronia pedi]
MTSVYAAKVAKILFAMLLIGRALVAGAAAGDAREAEKLELEIYRLEVPALLKKIQACESGSVRLPESAMSTATAAYSRYLSTYYEQEARMRVTRADIFAWQIFAANCVLALVAVVSIAGVSFAGLQLWAAYRIARTEATTIELEVSKEKIRLQTSVIGIVVLVISGFFLIIFLHDVYKIDSPDANARQTLHK